MRFRIRTEQPQERGQVVMFKLSVFDEWEKGNRDDYYIPVMYEKELNSLAKEIRRAKATARRYK